MGYNLPISQILGLGEEVRVQNPKLQKTRGESPRWYIRPYVDRLSETGERTSQQERIYLGSCEEMAKRPAITEKNRVMATINRSQYVVQAQINFGAFLDEYERDHVNDQHLAVSTQGKYRSHLKNHIRPAFEKMIMAEVTTREIDRFLKAKAKAGISSATRTDLRNILCGIFTQADKWGYWKEKNPALNSTVGRHRPVREQRKLTIQQTRKLLGGLVQEVRLICEAGLYCTLRISEVLGLRWKHIDFAKGLILVRERYYRGDSDEVKTARSNRDVVMGDLSNDLKAKYPGIGHEEEFVFSVPTHVGDWKTPGVCRDDRDINQHFLRPVAVDLGLYWVGFGFHAFRREAVTEHSQSMGSSQAQRMAGHAKADMTQHYTMADTAAQKKSVRALQKKVRGGKVVEMQKVG